MLNFFLNIFICFFFDFLEEEEEFGDVYTEHTINDFRAKAQITGNFQEFWKRSQAIRLKQINEIESLQEILTRWPEYKESNIAEWVCKYNKLCKKDNEKREEM